MNKWQSDVEDFHYKFGQPIRAYSTPEWSRPELRKSLIEEEAKELCDAIQDRNLIEVIDGACDLIYVVLGTMIEMGIDLDPFFSEVHKTNMAKEGGPTRSDGKILKPDGWKPPQIEQMIKDGKGQIQ